MLPDALQILSPLQVGDVLLINAWYLDDGTLCGSQEDLATDLSIIESEVPPRGLFLNRGKSFIYTPVNSPITHPLLRDISYSSCGFTLPGSPIGPPADCEAIISKRVRKIQGTISRLNDLQDSQMETTLLRSCLALPKVAYVLRTCSTGLIVKALITQCEMLSLTSLVVHCQVGVG